VRATVATLLARELSPYSREMPAREGEGCPYRKPTQVGWLSKLRWTSDPWLRNSANYSRTFGIRETAGGEALYAWSGKQ
jgi:hypothetical protein